MAFYTSWTEWCVVGFKEHNANDILENKSSISFLCSRVLYESEVIDSELAIGQCIVYFRQQIKRK